MSAQATLRGDILAMGADDFVSMADVLGQVSRGHLAGSKTEGQQLVVSTVRSLLSDGLIEIGVIPSPNSPGFKIWPGSVDDVMTRFEDRFIKSYDDRRAWEYAIWFRLTPEGEEASGEAFGRDAGC